MDSKPLKTAIGSSPMTVAWTKNSAWITILKSISAIILLILGKSWGLPLEYLYAASAISWNQKQFTNLLKTNKGRIHNVEKVADRTGEVQDQTHWAALSCPPKLKLNVSRASIKGKTMPLKANIERQKTPPFNRLHWSVLCSIRGSLKNKILLISVHLN